MSLLAHFPSSIGSKAIYQGGSLFRGQSKGASACYLIEKISAYQSLELHCINTWEGGIEHRSNQSEFPAMSIVEERFHNNIAVAKMKSRYPASIFVHKSPSDGALTRLLVDGKKNYFDSK